MKRLLASSMIGLSLLAGCGAPHGMALLTPHLAMTDKQAPLASTSPIPSLNSGLTSAQSPISLPSPLLTAMPGFSISPPPTSASGKLHFFFCTDTHDGYGLFSQVITKANKDRPAFILDGGDLTEQGTANEFKILTTTLAELQAPFIAVPGNHDYKAGNITRFESTFGNAPRSFDNTGVHFVLIDDANQQISEATFQYLDQDLSQHQGQPIVVTMHVPVIWHSTPSYVTLLHKLMPGTIADPKVTDQAQGDRFTAMMTKYHVSLVLAGHTHLGGDYTVGGVPYVIAGAVGGKLINKGASHEYVDVTLDQGQVNTTHVAIDQPSDSMFEVMRNMLDYYIEQRKEMATGLVSGSLNASPAP